MRLSRFTHLTMVRDSREPVEATITIHRQFHVASKRSGTKQIQSRAKPVTPAGRVPRISRLLALAHHCFRLVQSGAIINQSELAHFGQISTTRMTQIIWLDNLAPDIQVEILFLPRTAKGRDPIKQADIRPIAKTLDCSKQPQMWKLLCQKTIGLLGDATLSQISAANGAKMHSAGLVSIVSDASTSL
jgi:hypothetical protein